MAKEQLIPAERIERAILLIRGQKVILDSDLADLYGVETRALIRAVKRNHRRFPIDFTFRLTLAEAEALRSQIVISNKGRGGRRTLPYAFTEQGVAIAVQCIEQRPRDRCQHRHHAGVLSACGRFLPRTKTWREGWTSWKRSSATG